MSEEDLEALKRREYEEWFKSQEKEALEYSACVQYQEKASESQNVVKTMVTETTEQQRFSQQQHIEQQSSHQTGHNSSISGLKQGMSVIYLCFIYSNKFRKLDREFLMFMSFSINLKL